LIDKLKKNLPTVGMDIIASGFDHKLTTYRLSSEEEIFKALLPLWFGGILFS
jgi:hypothetical protein